MASVADTPPNTWHLPHVAPAPDAPTDSWHLPHVSVAPAPDAPTNPSFFQTLRNYVFLPSLPKSLRIPGVGTVSLPSFSFLNEKWSKLSNRVKWTLLLGSLGLTFVAFYSWRRRSPPPRSGSAPPHKPPRQRLRSQRSDLPSRASPRRHHPSASVTSTSGGGGGSISSVNRGSVTRGAGGFGDGDGIAGASVVNVNVNPQQLCKMGHECLEQALTYWEDALDLLEYLPGEGGVSGPPALPTAAEAKLARDLQLLVERATSISTELSENVIKPAEGLEVLRTKSRMVSVPSIDHLHQVLDSGSVSGASFVSLTSLRRLSDAETSEADSFVSAISEITNRGRLSTFSSQETLLPDIDADPEVDFHVYKQGLIEADTVGVEARKMRTEVLNCVDDRDFQAKLFGVRQAFDSLLGEDSIRSWFVSMGRQIIGELMAKSDKDPSGFYASYDEMMSFSSSNDESWAKAQEELEARNVKAMNFYDIVLDFIFLDAFTDLQNPPSSVVAIIQNRWLSSGFKESALQTAVFYVLKSKRHMMKHTDGFMAHFYDVSEHVTPFLAWGFLGPDADLNVLTNYFHDHLLGFIRDVFSFHRVQYKTIEEMKTDIMAAAKRRIDKVLSLLDSHGGENGDINSLTEAVDLMVTDDGEGCGLDVEGARHFVEGGSEDADVETE